mmetsp:Transcript_6479/g.6699  ORF Transcript_6479/g.6699 Transcript_6479/m.6699 type:complete len:332 (-) Transcript_6479:35-1030(-)
MSQATPPTPPPAVEHAQPTVRVMRLYKPCMHTVPTIPHLRSYYDGEKPITGPDFAISQFLLLPDSFGDIYLGEIFSAYISVVNGLQDLSFYQISLAVRLQTANATHDLYDSRAIKGEQAVGKARTLAPNASVDMVVQHTLSELGTHTLRVTVNYLDNRTNELKPLRKFYRFNVLNPVEIRTVCTDIGSSYVVQCQVINVTKSLLYIEEIKIITALKDIEFCRIHDSDSDSHTQEYPEMLDPDNLPLLLTDESFSYTFLANKSLSFSLSPSLSPSSLGVPEVKWCSCMGEHGYVRGEEIPSSVVSLTSTALIRPTLGSSLSLSLSAHLSYLK